MGINSVDMTRALSSETYAMQVIRNKAASPSERGQIIAHWGAEKVNKWESIDSTAYEITDDDYNSAYDLGKDKAKEEVGYDGGKDFGAVGDAVLSAGGATAASISVANTGAKKVTGEIADKVIKGNDSVASKAGKTGKLSAYIAAGIAIATAAKYYIEKPNEEQYKATMELYNANEGGLLVDENGNLTNAQADMQEATEKVVEFSEEAEEKNEEANDKIEDNKTIIDFYKKQYDTLKAKAESAKNGGEPLTPEEKAVLAKITPIIGELGEEITTTNEDTSSEVEDLYSDIEGYQENYDAGAETIATSQGVVDYAANFDSTTQTMCYVEGVSQSLNAISGAVAGAKLLAGGFWNWALGIASIAAGASSGYAASQQFGKASDIGREIDFRENVVETQIETSNDVYETELDTFAGSLETVEDLEIELPEELPTVEAVDTTGGTAGASMQMLANESNGVVTGEVSGEGDGEDDETNKPLEERSSYTSAMGKGSDWAEVGNGTITRKSDGDIVTDNSGKVILTSQYANAITSNGIKEGEKFGDKIPKVLETLLGSPFSEDLIKRIKNGESLTENEAMRFVGNGKSGLTADVDTTVGDFNKGSKDVKYVDTANRIAKRVIDFYYPIFEKASNSGWVRG